MNSLWVTMTSSKRAIVPLSVAYPLLCEYRGFKTTYPHKINTKFKKKNCARLDRKKREKWKKNCPSTRNCNKLLSFFVDVVFVDGVMMVFAIAPFLKRLKKSFFRKADLLYEIDFAKDKFIFWCELLMPPYLDHHPQKLCTYFWVLSSYFKKRLSITLFA